MGDAMDMDMDIDDAAQPIFISAGMSTTRLRDAPSNSSSRTAGASMRRGSISMAMSWKNSLGTSYNLLRAGNGTLSGMFSTSPVGNTIFDMLSKSITSGSFKDLSHIEQNFMQDFTCCGLVLRDLHELVQHWEDHQGQVDAGMETDMTLEDDDGWDDDTRTQPDENDDGEEQGGMMMGEMEMSHHDRPNHVADPSLPSMSYPSMRSRERDSASPRPQSPPTIPVSTFSATQPGGFAGRLGSVNPYEGMRAMPTDDAHPPSGVHPSMVAATGLHQPRGFRSPASASSPGLDEDDFGAVSDTMPRFDDVEEYEEVEEEDEVEVVEAAEADVDDEDDVEVEEGYDDLNEAPSTESDSGPEDMPAVASEPKPRGKRYPCTFSECDKVYKNPGGLKYHLAHSHPDPETALIPPGLLGRNGKRGKNVPDIYKPYRCLVLTCGKRYKNLNGLKYHLEHHHTDIQDDPIKMNLPRIYDKDGKPKWDLTGCYDPLLAKPVKKTTPVTPKPEPKPVVVQPSLLSQGTKSRSRVPPGSSSNPAPIAGVAPAAGGVDTSLLPPMGVFLPNGTQATSATPAPMSQSQIQVLANAIQQAAQNGQATPEQASQMMANLMQMVSINK